MILAISSFFDSLPNIIFKPFLSPRCPRGSRPATKNQPATEAEPYGEEALEFIKDQIMQREVEIEVESCDKAGTCHIWSHTKCDKVATLH